jgi:hypothetical protein
MPGGGGKIVIPVAFLVGFAAGSFCTMWCMVFFAMVRQ